MLDLDFSTNSLDYGQILRLTRQLTKDQRCVEQMFLRCVFNVVFNNRDDHLKNFAFQLGKDRQWRPAPACDITFSEGPRGQHWTLVNGKPFEISRADLLSLARQNDIGEPTARAAITQVLSAIDPWAGQLRKASLIRKEAAHDLIHQVRVNAALCQIA